MYIIRKNQSTGMKLELDFYLRTIFKCTKFGHLSSTTIKIVLETYYYIDEYRNDAMPVSDICKY